MDIEEAIGTAIRLRVMTREETLLDADCALLIEFLRDIQIQRLQRLCDHRYDLLCGIEGHRCSNCDELVLTYDADLVNIPT